MNNVPVCPSCGVNIDMDKNSLGEWYCSYCTSLGNIKVFDENKKEYDK